MRVIVLLLLLCVPAHAQTPCANRVKFQAAHARGAKLDNGKLVFCTDDVCWSMDPATRAFTSIATIPKPKKLDEGVDPTGRATATATGVEFCPTKGNCKTYSYKFKFEGSTSVALNAEGTLGYVTYAGDSMENQPTWTMLYDLSKPKEVKRIKTATIEVFGKTFWSDDTIYSADGKKLGKVSLKYDSGPLRVGPDLVVVSGKFDSKLFAFDATTAKLAWQLDLHLLAGKSEVIDEYQLVASPDAKTIFVVAGAPNSGEVIAVDATTGKQLARTSPPVCAGANVTAKPRKPEHVAKVFVVGDEVVHATKQNPLVYWLSANADSDPCMALNNKGTIGEPMQMTVLAKCIRDELGKSKITDKVVGPASLEVAVHSTSDNKELNQKLRDAAKGATIVGIGYGKNDSTIHVAVMPDGRITAVFINSNEI